jgi:phosphatidylinositol 4-kinase
MFDGGKIRLLPFFWCCFASFINSFLVVYLLMYLCLRLIEEVFGETSEGQPVPMDKVILLLWQSRDDPRVVGFMTRFLTRYSGERDIFDGIEFYLPQLAHMVIHLEANWDDAILERFALTISQHSLHFALQLNWILNGAIEDYQPETKDGQPNPSYNVLYYSRCVKLLSKLERCVVYGRPRAAALQRLYEQGKITRKEYEQLELADRRFNAAQIIDAETDEVSSKLPFGGWLLYKRRNRDTWHRRKQWKKRYFTVSDQMLYCHNETQTGDDTEKGLLRAMPLEKAEVRIVFGKYPHMFEVSNQYYLFKLRAGSKEELERWMKMLRAEAEYSSLFLSRPSFHGSDAATNDFRMGSQDSPVQEARQAVLSDLSPSEFARYQFFKEQRQFVRDICDVAEQLRFKERAERKLLAPGLIEKLEAPSCAYIPMCNNTDVWKRVTKFIPGATKVFNTKERCPLIVYYINQVGTQDDPNLDVATFLHSSFNYSSEDHTNGTKVGEDLFYSTVATSNEKLKPTIVWAEKDEEEACDDDHQKISSVPAHRSKSGRFISMITRERDWLNIPHMSKLNTFVRSPSRFVKGKLTPSTASKRKQFAFQSITIVESNSPTEELEAVSDYDPIDRDCLDRAKQFICGGKMWEEKVQELSQQAQSQGPLSYNFEIGVVMAKSNDDLRQEVFVMQMIHYYKSVFASEGLPIWLKTYRLISTSKETGLIEYLTDATSLDGLKKSEGYPGSMLAYFEKAYGERDSPAFKAAQHNFMVSLVGYSLVSYLLGLKDRHNGNVMIDIKGHLIHIDFGFAMGMAPGHELSLERAPFKLTSEYMDIMDGADSECFSEFKRLFLAGFEAARSSSNVALGLVEIMMYQSNYPCFSGHRYGGGVALTNFKQRLMLSVPDRKIKKKALELIE